MRHEDQQQAICSWNHADKPDGHFKDICFIRRVSGREEYSSILVSWGRQSSYTKRDGAVTNDFVREFFEDQPELLRRYERNEARYILQLPKNYDTISIDFGIDKNEMKRLVIALAELDLTIDEWLCFKMKELILADRLSKENRGEE